MHTGPRIARLPLLLAFAFVSTWAFSQAVQPPPQSLLPVPREYASRSTLSLAHGVRVENAHALSTDDRFAIDNLLATLKDDGVHQSVAQNAIQLSVLSPETVTGRRILKRYDQEFTPAMHDEGYVLIAEGHSIDLIAATSSGIFYATQTLKQLVSNDAIQGCVIRDWPAMKYRGFTDDLSRGPLPTLAFQEKQIRTMAAYKVNVYSPYFETTLAYPSSPLPALSGGTMSREDVSTLVEYARHYHMMIIPEQEAFGHLHNVLIYEQYQQIAETPLGTVLAPAQPGSLDLIGKWFGDLAQMFPSPLLHVGADETNDLGRGQTKAAVDTQGLGPVYVSFLTTIHQKLLPLHRRLLFWGDVAMNDPAAAKLLPKDMIAVGWHYNPEPDGYEKWLKPYTDAGMETWVAPGVNNWSRVYPDNDNALHNIQRFTADGQAAHSTGQLNTVWNDDGEGLFNEDWYGILFGAAAAWQPGTSSIPAYQAAYGLVFHGDTTGKISAAQNEITAIYQLLDNAKIRESTDVLFWTDPWSKDGIATAAEIRPLIHEIRMHAENSLTLIAEARNENPQLRESDALDALELGARRLDFIGQKFETSDRISTLYTQAVAAAAANEPPRKILEYLYPLSGTNGLCQDMRNGYSYARLNYQDQWLRENRPFWLPNVLARYDIATQLWVTRGDVFASLRSHLRDQKTLPSLADLGIPPSQQMPK
jgi:hypothetical protein